MSFPRASSTASKATRKFLMCSSMYLEEKEDVIQVEHIKINIPQDLVQYSLVYIGRVHPRNFHGFEFEGTGKADEGLHLPYNNIKRIEDKGNLSII